MGDNLLELYSQKILELAMDIPHQTPIEGISAKRRSPICGSEIEVIIALRDDKIENFHQSVRACALGQASAAIFGRVVIGKKLQQIETLRDELTDYLKGGDVPNTPFAEYETLRPAQDFPHRHPSILLVVETTIEATKKAMDLA